MELRDYQFEIIENIKKVWRQGFKSPCVVAPCGAGKTIVLAEIAKRTTDNKKHIMFIVHRKELCEQVEKTFISYGVDMNYCSINMIQTLVKRLDKAIKPDLILVDENHHGKASSYTKVFDYFNCHRIGVTATPVRLDGSGLSEVNDCLIESVSAKWLIENNFLSPAKVYSAPFIDTSKLKTKTGDYDQKQVEEIMSTSTIYGDIVKHWKEKANNKKTIVYCATVNYSIDIANKFVEAGIKAKHIDGKTKKEDREHIIDQFRKGEITMLCNCDIVSEGFDIPDCECVILLRPTKSLVLFIQQSMRCMRFKEGKQGVILDHVANTFFHGLPWQDRTWSLEGKKKKRGEKEKNTSTTNTCEDCFYTWDKEEGRICPNCGTEIKITEREIKIKECIELIEITEKMFIKSRKQKRQELKEIQENRNYKKGWVWHQMKKFDEEKNNEIENLKKKIIKYKEA